MRIGDMITVNDKGQCYDTFELFFDKLKTANNLNLKFMSGNLPIEGQKYKVEVIAYSPDHEEMIYLISDGIIGYLVDEAAFI